MRDINPITNEQIFLKKIAENTGSNYETGDVSEINPLTIDQIFLKEIAANTAGQSGDISELEEKVTSNTSAIEAIVNVNGCCNILPNNASTSTVHGATLTVNADKTVTIERVTPDSSWVMFKLSENVLIKAGTYTFTSLYSGSEKDNVYLVLTDMSDVTLAKTEGVESVEYTFASDTAVRFYITIKPNAAISTPITFKPMLYDARLNPTGYVPYAMTNRELTESVGALSNLNTTAKNNLVTAVNEVNGKVINYLHPLWHGLTLNETKIGNLYIATISGTPTEDVPAWSQIGLVLLSSNNVCFVSNEVFALQGFVIKNTTTLTVNTYYNYMLVCFAN